MKYSFVKYGSQLLYLLKETQLLRLKSRIEDNAVLKSSVHFFELLKTDLLCVYLVRQLLGLAFIRFLVRFVVGLLGTALYFDNQMPPLRGLDKKI